MYNIIQQYQQLLQLRRKNIFFSTIKTPTSRGDIARVTTREQLWCNQK